MYFMAFFFDSPSLKRKVCLAISEISIAVRALHACTARNLDRVLARTWPVADTMSSAWNRRKKRTANREEEDKLQTENKDHDGSIDVEDQETRRV